MNTYTREDVTTTLSNAGIKFRKNASDVTLDDLIAQNNLTDALQATVNARTANEPKHSDVPAGAGNDQGLPGDELPADENTDGDENTDDENTDDENTDDENTDDENTDDENTDDGENDPPAPKSIVPPKYKEQYGKAGHCGDEVALAMKDYVTGEKGACSEDRLQELADQNGLSEAFARWDHLNIGQRRMNLGNALRHKAKNAQRIQIGEQIWNDEAPAEQVA